MRLISAHDVFEELVAASGGARRRGAAGIFRRRRRPLRASVVMIVLFDLVAGVLRSFCPRIAAGRRRFPRRAAVPRAPLLALTPIAHLYRLREFAIVTATIP